MVRGDSSRSFALKVSGWLVPDLRRHLFFLVWICGVPIHVRYVVHLLRMSAVSLEMMMTTTTTATTMRETDGNQCLGVTACDDRNEKLHNLSGRTLQSTALDILFALVAGDCSAANAQVKEARLSGELWSEVRSLTYSAGGCHVWNPTARIISQKATVKGEVLALLPAGDVPLEEIESMYFTALDQARMFEQQHICSPTVPDADCEADGGTHALAQKQRPHGTPLVHEGRANVILIDSDDGENPVEREVVVLSDDSTNSSCRSVRRRRRLSETVYEVVE